MGTSSAQQIYKMSGCLPKCDKYSYNIKPMNDMVELKDTGGSLLLQLYIPTAETEVREQVREMVSQKSNHITKKDSNSLQYIVYNADALVADIGGYLGLLLGHSIYSVLVTITRWLKNAKAFRAPLH